MLHQGQRPLVVDMRSPASQPGREAHPWRVWIESHAFDESVQAQRKRLPAPPLTRRSVCDRASRCAQPWGFQRWGSRSSMRLLSGVGSRTSTSRK